MKLEKFDYQIGNKRKKNTFLILGLVCLGAFVTIILYRTFARFEVTNSYNIIGGKVADFSIADGLSMYLVAEDGTESPTSIIPLEDEYVYDATRSKCVNGTEIIYDKENDSISIDESAGDTCNVYFNYIPLATQTLYAFGYTLSDVKEGIPYGPDGTNESGFYKTEDDYGISYYYYTALSDMPPYISFYDYGEGYSYFLVRINGNGSIRLLTDFTNYTAYNDVANDNKVYLGYVYNELGVENIENFQSSAIKNVIDNHHNTFDNSLLSDAIFCNDRSLYVEEYGEKESDDFVDDNGNDTTYYGAYYRIRNNTPSLKCKNKNDAFTIDDTQNGNGLLDYPVGLLTADEAYMTNINSWLYSSWASVDNITMSPAMFKDGVAYIYGSKDSELVPVSISEFNDFSEVINVKYGVTITGSDGYYDITQ